MTEPSQSVSPSCASVLGAGKNVRCDYCRCQRLAVLRFDDHSFCFDHLVSHCYARLEAFQHQTTRPWILASASQTHIRVFLEECTSKVAAFIVARSELPNLERARLFDVFLWAVELDRKFFSGR